MRRVINNIRHHTNWLSYYLHKYGHGQDAFTFHLRTGPAIKVPQRLLQTYKEVFFDETYVKGFPAGVNWREADMVVDIGANVGYFSMFMASINPHARILSFEPIPANLELMHTYQKEHPHWEWTIINKAVASDNQPVTLHYDASDSFTTAATVFGDTEQPDELEVKATSLKQIFQDYDLEKIDFLKMDCEGSEYDVLYNTDPALINRIGLLAIETHPGLGTNENLEAMIKFLKEQGFHIKNIRSKIWGWRN